MAKKGSGGFDMHDVGKVPPAPSAGEDQGGNLGVPAMPARTTMGTGGDAPRTGVARNPKSS